MKRTYDPRKVKRHRSYDVHGLAELYQVGPNTVRQWIKKHGLPVIEDSYPTLMHCEAIRSWMIAWQAARKWTCAVGEMSCLGCQGPRKVKAGTFRVAKSNKPTLMLHGDCETCGKPMNRATSREKLAASKAAFEGT
jgi:hypothetical protein